MLKNKKRIGYIIIAILCIGLPLALLRKVCTGDSFQLGYRFGYAFAAAFFYSLLCLLLKPFRKKGIVTRLSLWGFCFSVLFFLTGTYQCLRVVKEHQFLAKSQKEFSCLVDDTVDSSAIPPYSPKEYGDYAHRLNFQKQVLEYSKQERQRLGKLMDEANLDCIMDPKNLMDLNHLISSEARLKKIASAIDENENQTNAWFLQIEKKMAACRFEDYRAKDGALKGIRRAINEQIFKNDYAIIRSYIIEYSNILDFLIKTFGTFHFEEETLIFENDTDLQAMEIHMQSLLDIEQKAEEISKSQKETLNSLKEWAPGNTKY